MLPGDGRRSAPRQRAQPDRHPVLITGAPGRGSSHSRSFATSVKPDHLVSVPQRPGT